MESLALPRTPEILRHNWSLLSPEQIEQFRVDNLIDTELAFNIPLSGHGRHYAGRLQLQLWWVWKSSGEQIAPAGPWYDIPVKPATVRTALLAGLSSDSECVAITVLANGGTMPNLLPPYEEAEPSSEPAEPDNENAPE